MGGYGSGRQNETAKLDDGLRLDINKLVRDGVIKPRSHSTGVLTWSYTATGEKKASISYEVNTLNPQNMWLRVIYTHTGYSGEGDFDYKIDLVTTRPHFGGHRFWFVCPRSFKTVAVLYGRRYFLSRHAYNLKYKSQSKSPKDRAIDKMWRLKEKLNDEGNYWLKPKGMHWKTFHRLCDRIDSAEITCDEYFMQSLMKYMG